MPPDMATAMVPLLGLSTISVERDCEEYDGTVEVAKRRGIEWFVPYVRMGARIMLLPRLPHVERRSIVRSHLRNCWFTGS